MVFLQLKFVKEIQTVQMCVINVYHCDPCCWGLKGIVTKFLPLIFLFLFLE